MQGYKLLSWGGSYAKDPAGVAIAFCKHHFPLEWFKQQTIEADSINGRWHLFMYYTAVQSIKTILTSGSQLPT
eukprot:16427599-Heterocapsa_arctica.AAC.1